MAFPLRISMINLGCRVNRAETDVIAADLEKAGCIIADKGPYDAVVVNTCAVTSEAEAKTRSCIRRSLRLPEHPLVVVSGCCAVLFGRQLAELSRRVIVEPNKDGIVDRIFSELDRMPCERVDTSVYPSLFTGRTRPNIKIQDGCNNRCTFCVVRHARGKPVSCAPEQVLSRLSEYCKRGAQEVVLCGINLGSYAGEDLCGSRLDLSDLLEYLLYKSDVGRLRISSIEPRDVGDKLLSVMARSKGRIAPYLHVCLQSGCDTTLQRMRRNYTTDDFLRVVERIRDYISDCAVETDLIAGFPGETDRDFETSLDFCDRIGFSKMHVFSYSPRPGTKAAEYPDQLPPNIIKQRTKSAQKLSKKMRQHAAEYLVGTYDLALMQSSTLGISKGLFDITTDQNQSPGTLVSVYITGVSDGQVLQAACLKPE